MFLTSLTRIYLVFVVPLTVLPPVAIALARYKYFTQPLKIFTAYLLVNGITNAIAGTLASHKINNLPILHLYTLIEFLLISFCYKAIFSNYPRLQIVINVTAILFSCFCIINSLYIQSIYVYNSYSLSISSIIIVIYTILLFVKTLDDNHFIEETKQVLLWINAAFMIYFGGSLFLFITSNITHDNDFMNMVLWNIHATLVLIMYILFTTGLLYAKKHR